MNHWAFVYAAYAVTLAGMLGLALWGWLSMRQAEAAAESLRRGP
jgi:hypothetical protein